MKYIKLFNTTEEYNTFKEDTANFILPNLSVCEDVSNKAQYNRYIDPYNGHEYVEIGGLKWATMNVGANSITDYGWYFQWGDVSGYTAEQAGVDKVFDWLHYRHWTADTGSGSSGMSKYNNVDNKNVIEACDDAARANWGGMWRMATPAEFQSLLSSTNYAWTSIDGVIGVRLTDKTDNSKTLFFPKGGNCMNNSISYLNQYGYYWTSTVNNSDKTQANAFSIYGASIELNNNHRSIGRSIRAVIG